MIKDINTIFKYIGDNHPMINTYQTDEESMLILEGNDVYPLLFLEQPFNATYTFPRKSYSISFSVFDYLDSQDESTYLNTLQKCEEIVEDILVFLNDNLKTINPQFTLQNTGINYLTLRNTSKDNVSGVRCEITINTIIRKNVCQIPISV